MKREKRKVGVLGATGAVGQMFVRLLQDHPWFELTELAASDRSSGRAYGEAVHWLQETPLSARLQKLTVKPCTPDLDCELVFSALDASVAGEIEAAFAKAGYGVFSNARNYRMEADVPLLVAELNPEHAQLVKEQKKRRSWKGFIVTNPNCSTTFLAMALAPLDKAFGVDKATVTTMQAISGAGYPGVASWDILGNLIPFIGGEEEKIELETKKILGALNPKPGGCVDDAPLVVSAQCNRVPVENGHTECVSVKLRKKTSLKDLTDCLAGFSGAPQELGLPSAPQHPIVVVPEENRPQPKRDVMRENGMSTLVGRIRPCPVLDYRFVLLGHNTIRGAAGASILNAELCIAQKLI